MTLALDNTENLHLVLLLPLTLRRSRSRPVDSQAVVVVWGGAGLLEHSKRGSVASPGCVA